MSRRKNQADNPKDKNLSTSKASKKKDQAIFVRIDKLTKKQADKLKDAITAEKNRIAPKARGLAFSGEKRDIDATLTTFTQNLALEEKSKTIPDERRIAVSEKRDTSSAKKQTASNEKIRNKKTNGSPNRKSKTGSNEKRKNTRVKDDYYV